MDHEETSSSTVNDDHMFRSPPVQARFYDQFDSPLSTKREKMRSSLTCRPGLSAPRAVRTAPPLSRVYPRRFALQKPHQVSFRGIPGDNIVIRSPIYKPDVDVPYFDQCFTCERKLGQGSFGERGRLYIQTELCETSLSEYCNKLHSIPENQLWNFFIDLLLAVDHLHDHDLLHVDIKPENIFLTGDKVCKLGDFGLIFDLNNDQSHTAEEGDSKYLAPEVLNGEPSKAADIFSLGITILEVATDLDLPSRGDGWHQIRSGNIPERFFNDVSADLRRLILWLMSPDPFIRPTTKQVLNDPAIRNRLSCRMTFLHYHKLVSFKYRCLVLHYKFNTLQKTSITYHADTMWLWLIAFIHLLAIPFLIFAEALQKKKNDVCTTPYKSGNVTYRPHTPELSSGHNLRRQGPIDLDWSFSDEENIHPQLRHTHTIAAAGRRSVEFHHATDGSVDPCPRYRLNFDEDTPTSSSDPNDSPLKALHQRNTNERIPSMSSPSRKIIRRSDARAMTEKPRRRGDIGGAGDWSPSNGGMFDYDSDDSPSLIADHGYMSCPPIRIPMRTQLRNRSARPFPRLDFSILDPPSKESASPTVSTRRSKSRMIGDQGSSAEEL
uniref:Membrane-associated tyrosine- and threonine-specific cdc2-inhibitory kinase wee-1.3 n=1 Tax=Heterorhabditis bacteriophora TaxID=37862 RepID=A0A1I7X7V7_HETBA